LRECYI